jgi:pimeloyl-ACP methyl ester carboxylesterase
MQWSDEEREKRAKETAERNARLVREREERQRKLMERDQSLAENRETSPLNMQAGEGKQYVMDEGNYGDNAQGLFGWANNNPSSKNAIYDTEFINSAAGGAGTADMIIEMRGKGRTAEGKEVTIKGKDNKDVKIFYRQVGEQVEGQAPVVCVHGVLDHSWSWREMQQLMAKDGVASYALDMPGCGYSSWPQPGFDYEWSEEGVKETLGRFVEAAGINGPITLMVQGFVYGQYALIWGLENPDLVQRIIVLNTPLRPGTPLPFVLQQYQLPIVASFVAQDAMRAERFLEGGCAYAIDPSDCDRYREPFLESMMPGLAVTDLMKRFDMEKTLSKTAALASKDGAGSSVLVAWATDDKYLTQDSAKAFCDQNGANFIAIPVKFLMAPHSRALVVSSTCT